MRFTLIAFAFALFAFIAPAHAGPLSGEWRGSYICAQGETGLTLIIRDAPNARAGDILAEFRFYALPHNPDVPSGVFTMAGRTEPDGTVTLLQQEWEDRPFLYEMVDLFGARSREGDVEVISGRVGFPYAPGLCTVFRVARAPAAIS